MSILASPLTVRLYGQTVGHLHHTESGQIAFQYLKNAPFAVSIGLPVREASYDPLRSEAFFGGLLPESEQARRAIGQRYGVNPHHSFSLLKAIGHECAGAISLHEGDHPEADIDSLNAETPLDGHILSASALKQHIEALPRRPLFLGVDGLRLSLAGAQDKAAVCLIENQIALPLAEKACPTTHILKPEIAGVEGIVQNEYFCLKLAERLGMPVPACDIRWAEDVPFFLIERYDRVVTEHGTEHAGQRFVRRIHQEDFCQALGIVSALKYQREGGPDLTACFDLLRQTRQPVRDRNQLAARVAFNVLIGNMDAHGKNFSLLHTHVNAHQPADIAMTPVYDVLCTRIYPELSPKMAMKIGNTYDPDQVWPKNWRQLCETVGYGYPAMRKLIISQAKALPEAAHRQRESMIAHGMGHPVLDRLVSFVEKQAHRCLLAFETAG